MTRFGVGWGRVRENRGHLRGVGRRGGEGEGGGRGQDLGYELRYRRVGFTV